ERAEAKGLRFVVDVAAGERVEADRQALLTVVRNLVRNAIEHAAPATLRVSGDHRAVVFSDDGPGIPPARLARRFRAGAAAGGARARLRAAAARRARRRGAGAGRPRARPRPRHRQATVRPARLAARRQ